jgi:3-deoxy-manno-octulosonate cytidylyltransferase (CMP-KDO synthetase)
VRTVGVIPARLGSTRLKNKVIADLCGKPVIEHVYERSLKARLLDDVIIATDDELIREICRGFGGKVVLTSTHHRSGTERLTEVVNDMDVGIVVNIQGDEPFVQPQTINDLVLMMNSKPSKEMGTVVKRSFSKEEFESPNVVKAVLDSSHRVLYFSRSKVPSCLNEGNYFYKHIGLYAYTKDFLFMYKKFAPSFLEKCERLEQLRVLENGFKIWAIETEYQTIGIDTAEDLERAREFLLKEMARTGN